MAALRKINTHRSSRGKIFEVTPDDIDVAQIQIQYLYRCLSPEYISTLGETTAKDLAHLNKFRIQSSNSEAIIQMLAAACSAQWDEMFSILEYNPLIINCIANDRAWGALHQAAYFNEIDVVRRLLVMPSCDPFLKTKQDRRNDSGPGKTADHLTDDPAVRFLIRQHQNSKRFKKLAIPTFFEINDENDLEIRVILLTLASFHKSLYPNTIESDNSMTHSHLMQEVFEYIDNGDQWKAARRDVGYQLQVLGVEIGNLLLTSDCYVDIPHELAQTKESFYNRVIEMYTSIKLTTSDPKVTSLNESRFFYSCLNRSLRTEGNLAKPTLGEDLAYAAYGILLNAILMNWPRLKAVNTLLYRGLFMDIHDIKQYRVNTKFAWLDFTSASLDRRVAEMYSGGKVLFIIESSGSCKYSGRYLNELLVEKTDDCLLKRDYISDIFPMKTLKRFRGKADEQEVLIPSGAKFMVTDVQEQNDGLTCIRVELCDY